MKSFSTMAVTAVAAFFIAPLASAGIVEDYIHRHPAAAAVKRSGTQVATHSYDCTTGKFYGRYQFHQAENLDLMTICAKSHKSLAELDDTIRHEAVHVAQVCREGGPMRPVSSYTRYATPEIHQALQSYPKEVYALELEAFVIANQATNEEVAQLVLEACKNFIRR